MGEPLGLDTERAAEAIFDTVNGVMADAVTEACTKQGLDVRGFAMVAGGGAGGVHGAEIARRLGIPEVHCPLGAPVLSAMGMLTMDVGRELTRAGVWDRTAVTAEQVNELFSDLVGEQAAAFQRSGIDPAAVEYRRSVAMRYVGQFHELTVDVGASELDEAGRAALETDFHHRHEELYGYSLPWRPIEILECHLRGSVPQAAAAAPAPQGSAERGLDEVLSGKRECRIDGASQSVPVYSRDLLEHGHFFPGPALVDSAASTVYVPEAFDARVEGVGDLILTLRSAQVQREPALAGEARA